MTYHLPECSLHGMTVIDPDAMSWLSKRKKDRMREASYAKCNCDMIAACEQRVAEETEAAMMESFYWKPSPPHDQHYFADNICAYCVGRSEAFTAARKAVAALPEYALRDTCVAAIDALKEKR